MFGPNKLQEKHPVKPMFTAIQDFQGGGDLSIVCSRRKNQTVSYKRCRTHIRVPDLNVE